jgi:hypothetical protein
MKLTFSLAIVALIPLAAAAKESVPCLRHGEIRNVTFSTDLTEFGTPTTAQIVPGSARGMEYDYGYDDDLGPATMSTVGGTTVNGATAGGTTTFTVPIENKGGSLYGPNGVLANGGTEGPCIEVYVKFKIRYRATVCNSTTTTAEVGGVGGGTGSSICWEVWRYRTMSLSPPKSVCPC